MFGLSPTELMIVLLIVVLIFGGRKIPELMSGMGKGVKEFKKGMTEADDILGEATKIEKKPEGEEAKADAEKEKQA